MFRQNDIESFAREILEHSVSVRILLEQGRHNWETAISLVCRAVESCIVHAGLGPGETPIVPVGFDNVVRFFPRGMDPIVLRARFPGQSERVGGSHCFGVV